MKRVLQESGVLRQRVLCAGDAVKSWRESTAADFHSPSINVALPVCRPSVIRSRCLGSPGGAQAQPGTPYAITGTISEATDPAPIVRARIKLLHASDRGLIRDSIFTDENGAFRVQLEVAVGTEESLPIAGAYAADPISPNPISGSTGRAVIRYTVRSNLPERPELELHDLLGRRNPSEGRMASGIFFGRTSVRSASTNASTRTGETGAFSLPSSGEYVLEVKRSTATSRSDRSDHTGTFDVTVE